MTAGPTASGGAWHRPSTSQHHRRPRHGDADQHRDDRAGKPVKAGQPPGPGGHAPDGRTVYVGNYSPQTVTPVSTAPDTAGRHQGRLIPYG